MEILGTHNLGTFIIAGLLLNMTPGPDTLYILGRTIAQGRWAGIASVLGISAGSAVHTLTAAFGLSAILAQSALAFTCVKFIGAGYLIYLGVRMLIDRSKVGEVSTQGFAEENFWLIFRQAVLTNVLNPKVALFFLAFLPQFVEIGTDYQVVSFLFLGSIFIFNGMLWCLTLVIFASALSRRFRENARVSGVIKRATGGLFAALGLKLALSK